MQLSESEFRSLTDFLKANYGINLAQKKILIEGRLQNILSEKGFDNFGDYLRHVFADSTKQEITTLINKLTTNHTFFMREMEHFSYLRDQVLPSLTASAREKDLRMWSAGCSSGEEPYTLAITLAEFFGEDKRLWDTKVLATDISVDVLQKAERGMYPVESLQELPASWKLNYFRKIDSENYQIVERLRAEIIFRVFNLMDNVFPFKKKFHVIFCRNVMIYFDDATKVELVRKFYEMTEPGGYLFIGHAESISKFETGYQCIKPAVYRKG
ncbi:MAG: protein-glutamate O-methyltransferase CheR [Negativicutes bacterium]|nr:protein-glutamate O-methyltransferase CheR [Negativicutes bacterium]